jgi:hypothetical protein
LIDLRDKFLAHSSTEGTRIQVISPGARNPIANGEAKDAFDFNIGKCRFPKLDM